MASPSRWEKLLWPRWLPETARMPVIAQVTCAVALTALIMGPWWSRVTPPEPENVAAPVAAPVAVQLTTPPTEVAAPVAAPAPPPAPERPAHLNLDVRHSFGSVDLSVTVDGKKTIDTKIEGSNKRFGIVGKRAQRAFTDSIELAPGVRVVRVRVRSANDKFDQTKVERFELGSASVAALHVSADKNGLQVTADRPAAPKPVEKPAATPAPIVAAATVTQATPLPQQLPPASTQRADAIAELLETLRSMLIAIAGFVASAATGFVVQEFMRSRKESIFRRPPPTAADL